MISCTVNTQGPYRHNDARWLQRLRVHLTSLEREGILDLWDDTNITAGMKWKDELQIAIASSTVAVILVSADLILLQSINFQNSWSA